jgi:hypothetical protein
MGQLWPAKPEDVPGSALEPGGFADEMACEKLGSALIDQSI